MERRATIAWIALGSFVLLAGWWGLFPKIGTATEAEVRAHVAPELLQPLAHPEGGVARFEAMRRALDKLPSELPPGRRRRLQPPLDLTDPAVSEVIEILRAGPLDRSQNVRLRHPDRDARYPDLVWNQYEWDEFDSDRRELSVKATRVANGLRGAAFRAANAGDWAAARRHIDASGLLLERLSESDARLQDRRWSMAIEVAEYRAALSLAARRDLPMDLAGHLAALLAADRHSPQSLLQVLRGEMQYMVLPRIGVRPMSYYYAGTYDPLETAELLSTRFLAMVRDAGTPHARRSGNYSSHRYETMSRLTGGDLYSNESQWVWPVQRIRLNNTRNSIGRIDVEAYPDGDLVDSMQRARTLQDQVVAALAVVRFRHRAGRDPRDFAELVATGLLRAMPMDHERNQALPFDLKTLFAWPAARRN